MQERVILLTARTRDTLDLCYLRLLRQRRLLAPAVTIVLQFFLVPQLSYYFAKITLKEDSHVEIWRFPRGYFLFSMWGRIISSEVSFDSSEVLFLAHVENFYFPRGDLRISTWRLVNFYVADWRGARGGWVLLLWGAFRIFVGRGLLSQGTRAYMLTNRY